MVVVHIKDVVAALRTNWWLPVVGMVLTVSAALAWSLLSPPVYTSQLEFFVSTTGARTSADAFAGSRLSEQRLDSYAKLLGDEELAGRVAEELDLDIAPSTLADKITANPVAGTLFINVMVEDASPEQAHAIAQAVATEFPPLVTQLETAPGETTAPVAVTVADTPEVPTAPSSPQTERNVVVAAGLGLLVGALAALARRRLDRSVRDAETAETITGMPVIGTILRDPKLQKGHVYDALGNGSAETYRQLRNNLQFVDVDNPPKVIMVTSAMPAEGKTTLTLNLALALAEGGRQVAIVDADLRQPRISSYLNLVENVGLTNVLAGSADLGQALQQYGPSLSVLGAGPSVPNPSQLLSSRQMTYVIDELAAKNDFVLVDTPPVLAVADATGLAAKVDGVVLSVRYGHTDGQLLRRASSSLERVGAKALGVVFNIVPPRVEPVVAYGYGATS